MTEAIRIEQDYVFSGNGYKHYPLVNHGCLFNIDLGDENREAPKVDVLPVPLSLLNECSTWCHANANSKFVVGRVSSRDAQVLVRKPRWSTWTGIGNLRSGDCIDIEKGSKVVSIMASGCMVFDPEVKPTPELARAGDPRASGKIGKTSYRTERGNREVRDGVTIHAAVPSAELSYDVYVQKSGIPLELTAAQPMWVVYEENHTYTAVHKGVEERGEVDQQIHHLRGGAYLLNTGTQMSLTTHLLSAITIPVFQRLA